MKKKIVFALFLTLAGTLPIFADEGDNYNNPFDDEDPWGNKSYVDTIRLATCENEPIEYEGKSFIYGSAGTYCDSVMRGDDTIHRVIIDVHKVYHFYQTDTVCVCDSMPIYNWNGHHYVWSKQMQKYISSDSLPIKEVGEYYYADTIATLLGCDSIWNLHLTVLPSYTYSGTCGANLTWSFDIRTGILDIIGSGEMDNWNAYWDVPWIHYGLLIDSINIPKNCISIGDYAFYDCNPKSITIPKSITKIGGMAFFGCVNLTGVFITDIEAWCKIVFEDQFANPLGDAHNLYLNGELVTNIVVPNSITDIKDWVFFGCSGLTSVAIPNSVTAIGNSAFYGCSGLISVTIPNFVTTIGSSAFDNCSSLTSITIPNSVTAIGNYAFYNCKGLTSINVDAANTHYGSVDGVLFNYTKDTLIQYPIGNTRTTYIIPNSVTTIGDFAFEDCSCLTSVTIPNSVTTIGKYAFSRCSGLTEVTIPNSVTTIGNYAFEYCSGLTSVTIGNSVTTIGNYAFEYCSGLTEITIPNSVTTIGKYAFSRCSGLTSVTIGNSVTTIGDHAFYYCSGLTSITCLAVEPPSLGSNAFNNVPHDIPLYVPVSSIPAYQEAAQWNKFKINPIVDINPITPDTTQLSWLPVDSASLYKLRIYSEQIELDTTLLIEADSLNGGISILVTLAPNRDRRMPMDDIGSVVVITLEPNSGATKETPFRVTVSTTSKDKIDIGFDLTVLKGEKSIKQESGNFALNAPVLDGLENIPMSRFGVRSGIYDLYGRHYPLRQWNQLPAGIYILREGEKASKVMKR